MSASQVRKLVVVWEAIDVAPDGEILGTTVDVESFDSGQAARLFAIGLLENAAQPLNRVVVTYADEVLGGVQAKRIELHDPLIPEPPAEEAA